MKRNGEKIDPLGLLLGCYVLRVGCFSLTPRSSELRKRLFRTIQTNTRLFDWFDSAKELGRRMFRAKPVYVLVTSIGVGSTLSVQCSLLKMSMVITI